MRVVIYDEEFLEPITVVNLPGLTERNLEEKQHWKVSVRDDGNRLGQPRKDATFSETLRYVDISFEKISRITVSHGKQDVWMCLTRAADLAMLLTPDWLPGQRPAIDQLQEDNERLASLIVDSLVSRDD